VFPAQEANRVTEPHRQTRRPRRTELVLGAALAATIAGLVSVLLTGAKSAPSSPATTRPSTTNHTHVARQHSHSPSAHRTHRPKLPRVAAAAATFVGDLEAGVTSGQVSTDAGQNLFNQLQRLLFQPPDQDPERAQQQYGQLAQVYEHYQADGKITGRAALALGRDLDALRSAVGAR
jgi:hypothetical protein